MAQIIFCRPNKLRVLWDRLSVLNFNGKLEHLSKGQIDLGLESSEVDISIKDFSVITALLELAGRNIKECRSKDLICTNFVTNLSDNELFNMKYNNLNVRSFFFTGNLINLNYRLNECTPTGKIFVASLGAAILCDLTQIVPRYDDILKYLEQKYPNNSALAIHEVFFEPDSIISKGLLTAIKDTEQIGDLYLLIGDAALNNSNSGTETTQIIN